MLRYALYGGVVTAATIGLPVLDFLNCFCCAGVILGGVLSVFFCTRDLGPGVWSPTTSDAVQLGALSGVFGALLGSILKVLMLLSVGDVVRDLISSQLGQGGFLDALPPELIDSFEEMLYDQEPLSVFNVFALLVVWLFVGPLFGVLGGVIGFALFRPKVDPFAGTISGTPIQPPPNPPVES